jgi:hypothetical protein
MVWASIPGFANECLGVVGPPSSCSGNEGLSFGSKPVLKLSEPRVCLSPSNRVLGNGQSLFFLPDKPDSPFFSHTEAAPMYSKCPA